MMARKLRQITRRDDIDTCAQNIRQDNIAHADRGRYLTCSDLLQAGKNQVFGYRCSCFHAQRLTTAGNYNQAGHHTHWPEHLITGIAFTSCTDISLDRFDLTL